ncbi:MAG: PEP-CTERM sorting domain-containing protein, partial [Proteobacteria bacterium]|nr:PEP-CTERM sorting domain-containing protein [Pseudomonadota bacterium]
IICDFSNTGSVGLILPDNVSFTSDSGVFLTDTGQPTTDLAEPSSLAGFGLAIFSLAMARRAGRRSCREAASAAA